MKIPYISLLFSTALVLQSSCSSYRPVVPEPPEFDYVKSAVPPIMPTPKLRALEEVVNTAPTINKHASERIETGSSIGVMDFKSTHESGSGNLVADTFSINFFRAGLQVVERENIKKVEDEIRMAAEGATNMGDEELAQTVGKRIAADYMVFGAVTQYHFENSNLPIPYYVDDYEYQQYLSKLHDYRITQTQYNQTLEQRDQEYLRYVEDKVYYDLLINHMNPSLHMQFIGGSSGGDLIFREYSGAQNIDIGFAYLRNRKVAPFVGKSSKEIEFLRQSLVQDLEEAKSALERKLRSFDRTIDEKTYKKTMDGKDENFNQRLRVFAKSVVQEIMHYYSIASDLRRCRLEPIPESKEQFDIPDAEERFVSIANLGITFKIIDVKTSEIIWIGQATKRDVNIQNGLDTMVQEVVKQIMEK